MLRRIIWFPIALLLAALLVTLAVANRAPVRLVLDPFKPDAPVLYTELPLYAYLLGALILGVLIGGVSVWFKQGRFRSLANSKAADAMRWQAEADRLTRERDANIAAAGRPLIASSNPR